MDENQTRNLGLIMDVQVDLTVQLGTTHIPMKELLELSTGTVLQLDQHAKDPVKLFVNGTLAAFGEVVVVEDHFGVKITELASVENKNSS